MNSSYSSHRFSLLSIILLFLSLCLFVFTLHQTTQKINKPFPGYLTFENKVVGPFYVPDWSGVQKGIGYHHIVDEEAQPGEIFTKRDYVLVVLLPAIAGLLFVLLGIGLCLYLPPGPGRLPLLIFHFLCGSYLIGSPEFHLTYQLSYFHLAVFAFIPATMIHFALLFPEKDLIIEKHRVLHSLSYVMSGLVTIPYIYFFLKDPKVWILSEYVVVFYVASAYLFWIVNLMRALKRPQLDFRRIIAKYLLIGQLMAFAPVLLVNMAIFIGGTPVPLNFVSPLTLLFPIALFLGVILARLRQSQIQLVQIEKRAALSHVFSGLAHEINNPLNFIYSNIEPLREISEELKKEILRDSKKALDLVTDLESLTNDMEEGASRAKGIIDNLRYFSYSGQDQGDSFDVHRVLDQAIKLLTPKWKNRITIKKDFSNDSRKVIGSVTDIGQVFVNILANACDAIKDAGTIQIKTSFRDKIAQISIRDTGVGIDKEKLARIFDPFYTSKDQGEGTGLGLSISSEIIKKHHGSLDVKSEVGKGTEVVITI